MKYLAAFTCAMLNNQPMGFYTAAVLVKDAQRHGLRVLHIDVQISKEVCTVETSVDGALILRLGLNYVRGLKRQTAEKLVQSRDSNGSFSSVHDLALRVSALTRNDLSQLASIGALNSLETVEHRRDAIWQIERASRPAGPLLGGGDESDGHASPLRRMNTEERLVSDYSGTGLTTGPHPMAYRRAELQREGVCSAQELHARRNDGSVCIAGCVIARQRPGTAQGFIFLSLEDETGISNIIINPRLYEQDRALVSRVKFLKVYGRLQNQDGVIHIKAERLESLAVSSISIKSHDFH